MLYSLIPKVSHNNINNNLTATEEYKLEHYFYDWSYLNKSD